MATRKKLIIKTKQDLAMILYMVLGTTIMKYINELIFAITATFIHVLIWKYTSIEYSVCAGIGHILMRTYLKR